MDYYPILLFWNSGMAENSECECGWDPECHIQHISLNGQKKKGSCGQHVLYNGGLPVSKHLFSNVKMKIYSIPFQGVGAIETQAVYVATKYFIEGLSKSLRKEGLLDGVKV